MRHRNPPESGCRTFGCLSFWRGVRESALVLAAFVGFGLVWAAPGRGRDVAAPASYPASVVEESKAAPPTGSVPSTWLVDGFNVLHAGILGGRDRHEWWTEPRRRELLDRVSHFDDPCAELWVVFDGPRSQSEAIAAAAVGLHEVFADSADAWLLARVRAAEDPGRVAVVTADRAVAGRARHQGAQIVSPRVFLARCSG